MFTLYMEVVNSSQSVGFTKCRIIPAIYWMTPVEQDLLNLHCFLGLGTLFFMIASREHHRTKRNTRFANNMINKGQLEIAKMIKCDC